MQPTLDPAVLAELLDGLDVAMMLFDAEDRQWVWNRSFLRFFPEHEGQIRPGEPYRENLRRFYQSRLSPEDLPDIDRFIDGAVARHRDQQRPYTFQHRGVWVRVASLAMPGAGRLRVWTRVLQPRAAPPGIFNPSREADAPQPALIDHMADGVMVLDPDDRITAVNDAFADLLGLADKTAVLGRRLPEIYLQAWHGRSATDGFDPEARAGAIRYTGAPFELPLPGGRWVRLVEHRNREGVSYCVVADISALMRQQQDNLAAERRLRESEARYRLLAENSSDTILAIDAGLAVRYASPAATELLGWPAAELRGQRVADLIHPQDRVAFIAQHFEQPRDGGPETFRALHRAGHAVWVEARVRRLADGDGYVANLRDATRRKQAELALAAANAELAALAATDALTGLPNRRQFDAALQREWHRAQRDRAPLALLMIDIDHFKPMNDRHGHPVGDAILGRVAQALRDNVHRATDIAARYGGEEFAVVLPATGAEGAAEIAEAIRAAVAQRRHDDLVDAGVAVTVSIGIGALVPPAGADASILVRRADEALYRAKERGRNRVEG